MRLYVIGASFIALTATVGAQWLNHPTPGLPRGADGKPNLTAPAPRTADGKPDLTGVWQGNSRQRGSWDEANAGLGVGGTGRDPSAAVNPSSSVPPPGSELVSCRR